MKNKVQTLYSSYMQSEMQNLLFLLAIIMIYHQTNTCIILIVQLIQVQLVYYA